MSQENEGAPQDHPATGQQPAKGRKPTKAERRAARQALHLKIQAEEVAKANAGPFTMTTEKSGDPQEGPVTGQHPRKGENRNQDSQEGETPANPGDPDSAASPAEAASPADSVQTEARGRGRPSEYTEEEADAIIAWIGEGGSLKAYCRKSGRAMLTVYRWMREHADFHARYTTAREDRAESLADEMIEIADDASKNPTIEGVAAAKLRVEARKWIASKLKPNTFGDKQVHQHQGGVSIRIGIDKPQAQAKPLELVQEVRPALPQPQGMRLGHAVPAKDHVSR